MTRDLAGFAVVYLLAAASPGPGIAALVARALARGNAGLPQVIAGYIAGDIVWMTAAVTGLAAVARAHPAALTAVRIAGAGYLLVLAWRLVRSSGSTPAAAHEPPIEGGLAAFTSGLTLTLGNPKVGVFFLAVLPATVDIDEVGVGVWFALAALCVAVLTIVLGAWSLATLRARRHVTNAARRRALDRIAGGALAGAAVAVLVRT